MAAAYFVLPDPDELTRNVSCRATTRAPGAHEGRSSTHPHLPRFLDFTQLLKSNYNQT
jgi:hypothetical protein